MVLLVDQVRFVVKVGGEAKDRATVEVLVARNVKVVIMDKALAKVKDVVKV